MDLQFLDFQGLTDHEKYQLTNILKSDINVEALKLPWATENNNNVNSVPVTEVTAEMQNAWYNAMAYQTQIMTSMCNDWHASPMYNVPNGHMPPFMPGIGYHSDYNLGAEIHEVNYSRDNGRRNNRGKGTRRDNYNRALTNSANEMQSGYIADQGQFHPQIPVMYIYPDHQQHSVAGQIYYPPPMYSSTALQPHPSTHQYTHPTYPTHHPSQEDKYVQQSQSMPPQSNEEDVKQLTAKSQEKHTQQDMCASTKSASSQQVDLNEKKPTQINAVIAIAANNGGSNSHAENIHENTATKVNVTSNGEVLSINKTVKQNITLPVNENCEVTKKNEMSSVNINSDVEVKQNGEMDKKDKNEAVSTLVKTASKPVSKIGEIEVRIEENISSTNDQDKTVINGSSVTSNGPLPASGSRTSPTRSFASLFKNDSAESKTPSTKTMACVNRVHQNGLPKTIQKELAIADPAIKNQNPSSDTSNAVNDSMEQDSDKTLQNGVLESFYDDPNLFRMGEFLLHYQMDKQTVSLLPRGLTNRSNYCYINSILQALLACPLFYNLLKALPHPNNYGKLNKHSTTPLIDNMVRFIREFTPLSEAARLPRKDRTSKKGDDTIIENGAALEPAYVYTMLKYTSAASVFPVEGRQEDAEEFLSCLLNGINDEMLELMKLVNSEQNTVMDAENVNHNHNEEEWKVIGPKNKGSITRCTELERTPLSDIFRGQLRSRVSRAGEQPTDNVQPFFTLQLDIEKAESVKQALEILVGKDQLEGMTCSKTKKQIEAWKQVTLEELPIILILHLKWFVYKFSGCSKILKSVEFPIDLKIDSKFLSPNTVKKLSPKQKQYKLFAVTYHDGKEATKGHYVTDAFHVGYGGWVRYDDSSAKGISEYNVLKPISPRVPYLLYYRRCDTIGNNQSNNGKPR